MKDEEKKDLMLRILNGPSGAKRCAHLCALPFDADPLGVSSDMRSMIPADILPDVVFSMTADYVMKDIDSRDETPRTRKLIEARLRILRQYFSVEMDEGGRRAQVQIDQMFPKRR